MMKRIAIACLLIAVMGQAYAQIRLPERPNARPRYVDHSFNESGFWCAVEANVGSTILFKDGIKDAQRAGLSVVAGYMANEFLKVGLGLGGNYYFANNDEVRSTGIEYTMPIFLDVRGNMLSQEVRNFVPYWSVDVGGAIRDGFFFSPTIGMRFGEKRDSWLVGISYTIQQIKNWEKDKSGFVHSPHLKETPASASIVSVKLGYEF